MDPSRSGPRANRSVRPALVVLWALASGAALADDTCPPGTVPVEHARAKDRNKTAGCEDSQHRDQGPFRWWHENGALGGRSSYRDGRLEGWLWVWDEQGVLLSEREFRAGVEIARKRLPIDGPPRASRPGDPVHPCPPNTVVAGSPPPDGRAQWCERRRDDDAYVRDGPTLEWFSQRPGAPLKLRSEYRDGRKHGEYSTFRADGQLEKTYHYAEGSRRPERSILHPNGSKRIEVVVGSDGLTTETEWTKSGVLRSEIVKRGKETLRRSFWYRNGNQRSERHFSAGKRDGVQREWWPNGALWKEGEERRGADVGTRREWSPDGKLMEIHTIDERRNESRETFRVWTQDPEGWPLPRVSRGPSPERASPPRCPVPAKAFEDRVAGYTVRGCAIGGGTVRLQRDPRPPRLEWEGSHVVVLGGELHGPMQLWNENGQQIAEIDFRHDQYDGQVIEWEPDGTLRHVETYRAGVREDFASWWRNGAPRVCLSESSGRKNGVWLECRETGRCAKREEYRNGAKHGLWIVWWENAEKRWEREYRDGQWDGRFREWSFEGGLSVEGYFQRGRRVDDWKRYWPGGKPRSAGRYAWCATPPSTSKATLANGEVVSEPGKDGCKKGPWRYWSEEGVLLGEFDHDETTSQAAAPPRTTDPAAKSSY